MGFRCPVCGADFKTQSEVFVHMRGVCKSLDFADRKDTVLETLRKTRKELGLRERKDAKRSVDLCAVEQAVADGRLAVWQDGNGLIHMRNNRSRKEITFMPTYDMDSWMEDDSG